MKAAIASTRGKRGVLLRRMAQEYQLYLLVLPATIYFLVFHYGPMYGVQLAFKDFVAKKGLWGSPWIGLTHFRRFFASYYFHSTLENTFLLSGYALVAGFPVPILLALLLNEVGLQPLKRVIQTVIYAPHFISTVVMAGMVILFLSPSSGIVNTLMKNLGKEPVYFMSKPQYFRTIYVISGIWQGAGWGTIVYMAALAAVDVQVQEAAIVDGASRIGRIVYVNLPGITPMIVTMLILNVGNLMNVGFEKAFLLQNALNIETSEVISTYVYKIGLQNAQYDFSTAIGLFNSLINCVLLVLVNWGSHRLTGEGLW